MAQSKPRKRKPQKKAKEPQNNLCSLNGSVIMIHKQRIIPPNIEAMISKL